MTNRNTSRVTVRSRTLARAAAWVALSIVLALSLLVIFKEAKRATRAPDESQTPASIEPPKTGPWEYPPPTPNV
jgi:hypothetical protein